MEYRQKDEKKREEYLKEIEAIPEEKRIYIDESGIDNNIQRAYARAARGKQVLGKIWGGKPPRTNFVAALKQQTLIAPYAFEGSFNRHRFNAWLEEKLLPKLGLGYTIILDNATYHHSKQTQQLIEAAGCKLLYLPAYSPDFNPIEHYWHLFKSLIKFFLPDTPSLAFAMTLSLLLMSG